MLLIRPLIRPSLAARMALAATSVVSIFASVSISAQQAVSGNKTPISATGLLVGTFVDTSFATIPWAWRNVGPAQLGGYVGDIAVPLPQSPKDLRAGTVMYVASEGGLFKTTDGANSWKPLLDDGPSTVVSSVTVSPSCPNTVWVATGHFSAALTAHPGRGLLKSTDGGENWTTMGFVRSQYIGDVVAHPTNADIVYVGIIGSLTEGTKERGVYKTTDGGKSWKHLLFVNDWTGAVDLSIDFKNPDIIYAATWQQAVTPSRYIDFGPGSGIYRSKDGVKQRKATTFVPINGHL